MADIDDLNVGTGSVPSADWLDSLPTSVGFDGVAPNPAMDDEAGNVLISARIPPNWLSIIDEIRQRPRTSLPESIFKTRSTLFRWFISVGIQQLNAIEQSSGEGVRSDPILHARIFLEQQAGAVASRAQLMNEAKERTEELGRAVNQLMAIDEYEEAGNMINKWISEAAALDPFWRIFFTRTLLEDTLVRAAMVTLISEDQIIDSWTIQMCRDSGLIRTDDEKDITPDENPGTP